MYIQSLHSRQGSILKDLNYSEPEEVDNTVLLQENGKLKASTFSVMVKRLVSPTSSASNLGTCTESVPLMLQLLFNNHNTQQMFGVVISISGAKPNSHSSLDINDLLLTYRLLCTPLELLKSFTQLYNYIVSDSSREPEETRLCLLK